MARSRSKAKSAAKPARRRSSQRSAAAHAHEAALAAFAHDIRTALTGILALGELLASSTLGESERSWAAGIKASAEHLASLTTLVLDAAKADTRSLTLREEVFRPRRLIEFLADSLTTRAQTKGLAAEVCIADDLPDLLVGDAVRLRAAIENLIDNAVKFTERGSVRLVARTSPAGREHTRLIVEVHDSGIGLKPAEIKRLFRPFAQASAEIARHYGGTGLGLAIVKRLAKLMGGDLTVTSTPGRGSSFRFTAALPIASADNDAGASASDKTVPPRPLAILCAEDNPYGRVILNTILTELGHRADFVNSGEDAVGAVTRGYDIVLMDVVLPGIDGLEAARRIRALPGAAARTPIVGISGRSDAGDEHAARAAGMSFYLRKPVSPSALSEAIAAVISPNKDVAAD
jgi:two-component system, sensor histidine kinase